MSFFDTANEDATSVTPDRAATGPRVGFLDSFEVGWNAQVRASAMYGIENEMLDLDQAQVDNMRKAGIEDVPMLSEDAFGFFGSGAFSSAYLDVAEFYNDGGSPEVANRLQEYDAKIEKLRETYPQLDLKTSREMFDNVRAAAQEYENRANNDRRTFGGSVGAFLGGAVGSLNVESDPLNFLTTPIGGAGKTIIGRIAGQGAAQGFVEGINQITGVQEQRRLLGLDYGIGDAIGRVGGAIVGGAALQGVGEGVAAGVRRFFRGHVADGAPLPDRLGREAVQDTSGIPPQAIPADEGLAAAKLTNDPRSIDDYMHYSSPLSSTRAGRARTLLDVDYMTSRLEDWNGEDAAFVRPKTDTAVTLPQSDFVASNFQKIAERAELDDIARRVDPQTFRKYDTYADNKAAYKARIEELGGTQDAAMTARVDELESKITELMQRADTTGGKRAAKLRKDIKALEAEKQQVVIESARKETPEIARMRALMMREDEKMRDLAPLVSRAYARAQGKWDNTAADRAAVYAAIRDGRKNVPVADEQVTRVADAVQQQLIDKAPILQDRPRVAAQLKADADAADVASAIIADNEKIIGEAVEQYRTTLDSLIATDKNGEIELQGQTYKLNLDRDTIIVPNESGDGGREITIRQLLEENKATEHELEAVQTCSLRKTS